MKLLSVTFCTYDYSFIGGPHSWLRRLLPELHRQGIRIRVIFITLAPETECTLLPILRQEGFDCVVIPADPHYTEHRVRCVLEKLAEDPPDVFISGWMVPALYAGRWVREAGIPTVGVLHNDDDYSHAILSEFVYSQPAYQLSGIVSVSKALEQEVLKRHPEQTLVQRIPYGAPLPQGVALAPTGQLRLAYVGRLVEEQKRISEVTRALCRAVREVPNTEAVIYGEGVDRPAVEQILQNEGAGLPVNLMGRVDSEQVQEHLLNCHILVLLSDYEGLPIAVMEAMACGVVPICLQIRSGIPELVEDGVTGLVVGDRGDDFVAAVRRLRHEPGLWERLSQAARAKIEQEYSHEVCSAQWDSFLRELQQNADVRRSIQVPAQLNLPPIYPSFIEHDCREPSAYTRMLQKLRMSAGAVKHRLLTR